MKYFDEIAVGERWRRGSYRVTAEDIVTFARQWDPRPFHVDDAAARATPYLDGSGLIASGIHTMAIWSRLQEPIAHDWAITVGAGFDELRFHRPVKPGDELSVLAECEAKRPLRSRADRGLIRIRHKLLDAAGEPAMSLLLTTFAMRRAPPAPAS